MRVSIVQPALEVISETFLRAQAQRLKGEVIVIHEYLAHINRQPLLRPTLGTALRLGWQFVNGLRPRSGWDRWAATCAYLEAFRTTRPDVVLAQYGPWGVNAMEACRIRRVPIVVQFHGYDAVRHDVLERHGNDYPVLFRAAAAIVVVSEAMRRQLVSLGAPAENIHLNVYGVDCDAFQDAAPGKSPPVMLAVGNFVEKKSPHLTLLAFRQALREFPEARLRMIGDGPLKQLCVQLAKQLGIAESVTFLGAQAHDVVCREMQGARAFVQHSVTASDGDCEGTPLAVLEASASGLPVIATQHAGIPDVVIHGTTGLLSEEYDVSGMATHMVRLCRDSELAQSLGQAGRTRMLECHRVSDSVGRLDGILEDAVSRAKR